MGVARALAADPLVLLMDEPFSAVDPVVRSELHEFFLGLQREISKTIVLITHDIDEAIKLGDQVAILRVGGRLAQVGTPQQLLEEPADAFVEGFVGKDRGYRSLSFLPADGLGLERVEVVREVETAGAGEPTLVVDGDARPVGWANPDRPGQVFPLGSTFDPESDTLRTALDSALTSPYGLAVAVAPGTGRFAGVVEAQQILAQVADARAAVAESIAVRAAEETMRRSRPQPPPDDDARPRSPRLMRPSGSATPRLTRARLRCVLRLSRGGTPTELRVRPRRPRRWSRPPKLSHRNPSRLGATSRPCRRPPLRSLCRLSGTSSKADSMVKPETDSETKAPNLSRKQRLRSRRAQPRARHAGRSAAGACGGADREARSSP